MSNPYLKQLEQSILSLSIQEQNWLLERLTLSLQASSDSIQEMARDPQIQAEILSIDEDFSLAEEDGLQGL